MRIVPRLLFAAILLIPILSSESATAQTIDRQFRRVKVETMARDAIFDEDDVFDNDAKSTRNAGLFQEEVFAMSNTITGFTSASANQESEINVAANAFEARGVVETVSIEDGSSSNKAESLFRFDFTLDAPGAVNIDEVELEAVRANINDDPRDDDFERSDYAVLIVRVIDRSNNSRAYNKVLRLREQDEVAYFIDSFDVDLPAGNYRLIMLARITGDDQFNTVQGQPRGTRASYNIEGNILQDAVATQFTAIKQRIAGSFVGNDPYGDDPPSGSDLFESAVFDPFNEQLDLSEGSTTTIANQSSDVDPNSGVYYAYGAASSGLYVQGDASSTAESCFETSFTLENGGQIDIEGEIGVSSFLGLFQSRDEPGIAMVTLLVIDADTGDELFDDFVAMNGSIPGGIRSSQISETVNLPPGNFKLIIRADSMDSAVYEVVEGNIAVGYFEIEGTIRGN